MELFTRAFVVGKKLTFLKILKFEWFYRGLVSRNILLTSEIKEYYKTIIFRSYEPVGFF
nr:hypothetical protein [uncultured bacterium]